MAGNYTYFINFDDNDYIGKIEIVQQEIALYSYLNRTVVLFLLFKMLFGLKRVEF